MLHFDKVSIESKLQKVYSPEQAKYLAQKIDELLKKWKKNANLDLAKEVQGGEWTLSASDMALITYANSIIDSEGNESPLSVLKQTIEKYKFQEILPIVHILPFYPWDTDRGFSVKDYTAVDPEYGAWSDINSLGSVMRLMFDFVANHASIENKLVQGALISRHLTESDGQFEKYNKYKNFVIAFNDENKPSDSDLDNLARPRPNQVLTPYIVEQSETGSLQALLGNAESLGSTVLGKGWVWTTFSRAPSTNGKEETRQVDLNFSNPELVLEVIRILLFYAEMGVDIIRLDAIAYIWKKLGSSSIHEIETHILLEVIDHVLAVACPGLLTIAEVNEPEDKYFSYLGSDDNKESDLVYQFVPFPLAIYSVATAQAEYFQKWLPTTNRFQGRQFVTVLGSHDGMGLKPIRDIVPEKEMDIFSKMMVDEFKVLPNLAKLPGGEEIIYELCATPWNLVNRPSSSESLDLMISRYLAVLALGLNVRGIPAIYINGLIGTENYAPRQGLSENREINREIFQKKEIYSALDDTSDRRRKVLDEIKHMLKVRAREGAFSPGAGDIQAINANSEKVVSVRLSSASNDEDIISLVNTSNSSQNILLDVGVNEMREKLTDEIIDCQNNQLNVDMSPYQVMWLKYNAS